MNPDQEASLKNGLYYLGQHIHQLETWSQRSDTHPGLADSVALTKTAFDVVAEVLKPQKGSEQTPNDTLTTLNDRSEAFLDEFISRVNSGRDVSLLLSRADNIWSTLKTVREASCRPKPKL